MSWLWVAAGSAIGGVLRYQIGGLISAAWGVRFPWGTFVVNVVGSFAIGLLAVLLLARHSGAWPAREFLIVGLLGGFTTFSSFSLEVLQLLQAGDVARALTYVGASAGLCVAAAVLGAWIAERAAAA
jgi:fluoride exporter